MLKTFTTPFIIITIFLLLLTAIQSVQAATASYYGKAFHGKRTASGDIFNMHAMTAAHNSLPLGTMVKVTNLENKKTVKVKITDRGGFGKYGRTIDLSKGAFSRIANVKDGLCKVSIKVLSDNK